MKLGFLTVLSAAVVASALTFPVRLAARSADSEFSTFDAPGAGATPGSGWGTFSSDINNRGTITGYYIDSKNVNHGFVRSASGEFTTFDAPGASIAAASGDGTFPESINAAGAITGHYTDAKGLYHGFLRGPDGEFTTFDAPGAGTKRGSGFGTFPTSINDGGTIAGYYIDANDITHGFMRSPEGEFTTIDAPGANSHAGSDEGTAVRRINAAGAIAGVYADGNSVNHGFLWNP